MSAAGTCGESMTEGPGCERQEFYARLFRKLLEDITEALHRTPVSTSSRPYVERALRLVQAGYTAALEDLANCDGGSRTARSRLGF